MTNTPPDTALMPVATADGYLPIEDFGLIGDGSTAALVGRDGTVAWLCVPRFDDEPLFCSILDTERGGGFRIAPSRTVAASQRYEADSGVLITEMQAQAGLVRITDCLALRSGADLREDGPASPPSTPSSAGSKRVPACSTATCRTRHLTGSPATKVRSSFAASGWSTTSPNRVASTRPTSSTSHCAPAPAHWDCCPRRSTPAPAPSSGTTRRRSATWA